MKQLFIWTLFGMVMSAPLAVQASDGADALVRWHQQFKQEQKKLTERQAGAMAPVPRRLIFLLPCSSMADALPRTHDASDHTASS